jgi:hypothetical protein
MKTNMILSMLAILALTTITAFAGAGFRAGDYTVRASSNFTFPSIFFYGGELARVVVDGEGDRDLDLFVYDMNGRLVASDEDGKDNGIAEWWPVRGASYRVVVINRGEVHKRFTLRTN